MVLSGQAVPGEKLNEAREKEKNGDESDFKRPYIKLQFTKEGALKFWSASAGNASLGRRLGNANGELKLQTAVWWQSEPARPRDVFRRLLTSVSM